MQLVAAITAFPIIVFPFIVINFIQVYTSLYNLAVHDMKFFLSGSVSAGLNYEMKM